MPRSVLTLVPALALALVVALAGALTLVSSPSVVGSATTARVAELDSGWNLVGWTGADGTPVADALASIEGQFDAVFVWDASAEVFHSFRPALPPALNSLSTLNNGDGVWVFVNDLAGAAWGQASFNLSRDVMLARGFNLVGWTGPSGTPVVDAVAMIAGNLEALWTWDAAQQRFRTYTPAAPPVLNTATTLDLGDGVWLRLTHESTWPQPAAASLALLSDGFTDGETIPALYTCDGDNVSPPLRVDGIPAGTRTLTLALEDPDAPDGTWVHWVAFDIPVEEAAASVEIPADVGALGTAGLNSWELLGYGGPCPPSGTHRYDFSVYALSTDLGLPEGATLEDIRAAMGDQVLATAHLQGLFR